MDCSVNDTILLNAGVDKSNMMDLEIRELLRLSDLHCECIFYDQFEIKKSLFCGQYIALFVLC